MIPHLAQSGDSIDFRKIERQALALELRFSYRSGNVTYIGTGRTRNLGGETVCFDVDQSILQKGAVELRIQWPFRLQEICPLELVVTGRVVRRDSAGAVVRMESYEFQTVGVHSFSQTGSCGVTCNLAA